jgi:hypothetical protein
MLASCEPEPPKIEKFKRVVLNKSKEMNYGDTDYVLAYTNGGFNYVNFGVYSKCEIGDTLYFEREDGWYLKLIKVSKGKKKKIN